MGSSKGAQRYCNCFYVMDVWTNYIDKGDSIDTVYLDFTKAFDKCHTID